MGLGTDTVLWYTSPFAIVIAVVLGLVALRLAWWIYRRQNKISSSKRLQTKLHTHFQDKQLSQVEEKTAANVLSHLKDSEAQAAFKDSRRLEAETLQYLKKAETPASPEQLENLLIILEKAAGRNSVPDNRLESTDFLKGLNLLISHGGRHYWCRVEKNTAEGFFIKPLNQPCRFEPGQSCRLNYSNQSGQRFTAEARVNRTDDDRAWFEHLSFEAVSMVHRGTTVKLPVRLRAGLLEGSADSDYHGTIIELDEQKASCHISDPVAAQNDFYLFFNLEGIDLTVPCRYLGRDKMREEKDSRLYTFAWARPSDNLKILIRYFIRQNSQDQT